MSDPTPPPAAESPVVRRAQRWNIVWVVPLVALALGAWLLVRHFTTQGPVARVRFDTAEEIFAGKTEVRCRSVKVGVVNDVELASDLKSVIVHVELDTDSEHLLRRGTRFWVIKPRVSGAGISGLTTLIQGAYIELDPGSDAAARESEFIGLERPPATNLSVPGRRIVLTAEEAGLLDAGSPVYYRGFEVGRIEERTLSKDGVTVSYNAFIREEYNSLVTENTRFWNTSGIDISAGADGFKVRTPSLQAMISGGVAFGVAQGGDPGKPVGDGARFTLYRDEDAAGSSTFNPTVDLLLLFDQTVRGLSRRTNVEFRGITVGRVNDISFNLAPSPSDPRIPVVVSIDPSLMRAKTPGEKNAESDIRFIREAVAKGLRASLKTGSLITGALYVDLDYYQDDAPGELGKSGDYLTLPTVSSGFAQLEARLSNLFDRLEAIPLEKAVTDFAAAAEESRKTIAESRTAIREIEQAVVAARETLEDPSFKGLPADLRKSIAALEKSVASLGPEGAIQGDLLRTLDELRASLRSIKAVSSTVEERPNSLLFGRDSSDDPTPKAPRGDR